MPTDSPCGHRKGCIRPSERALEGFGCFARFSLIRGTFTLVASCESQRKMEERNGQGLCTFALPNSRPGGARWPACAWPPAVRVPSPAAALTRCRRALSAAVAWSVVFPSLPPGGSEATPASAPWLKSFLHREGRDRTARGQGGRQG